MNDPARPYAFPSLLDGATQTFVVIGTGLSHPDGPTAENLRDKRVSRAAEKLGLPAPNPAPHEKSFDLYVWAGQALQRLFAQGMSDNDARLALARALRLLDAPEWFGDTGLPLRGNTPRHRALARLVMEGCFSGFYCLNWDAWMDRALESVGLVEIKHQGDTLPAGRPWNLTAYARLVHDGHLTKAASDHVFRLYKPHGCVQELRDANSLPVVFKITNKDLQIQATQEQSFIEGQISQLAGGKPVLGIGWKASEAYLRKAILAATPAITEDAFILASRSWYPGYHCSIAQHRNSNMFQSHAALEKEGLPTTDTLFPWLFARYALRQLEKPAAPAEQAKIKALYLNLDAPENASKRHPLILWCDDWLPAWVRLCWQVGAMVGCNPATNQKLRPYDIPLGPPDLHIPLSGMNLPRLDLEAAARLLVSLKNCAHYDYSRFPGALWNSEKHHLILPLPTWGDLAHFNDLAGLKNLFTALRQHGLGAVQKVSLLALAPADTRPLDTAARNKLAALVAKRMPHAAYARSENLGWLELKDLKGDSHA